MKLTDSLSRREALTRLGGLFAIGLMPRALSPAESLPAWRPDEVFPHPEPRAGITAANVLPESRLPDKKRVRAIYASAREHPEIFDGIYCTCHCVEDGHRSLLSCFETDQATGCWGCQEVAEEVAKHAKHGKTLKEIRDSVDKRFSKAARSHY